jgi:hypothetical protein
MSTLLAYADLSPGLDVDGIVRDFVVGISFLGVGLLALAGLAFVCLRR